VADISGADRSRSKERSIGNVEVGVYEIYGMYASSRNANDTWAGTKKDHFNGVGHGEINP
jgi:hypothetical protein